MPTSNLTLTENNGKYIYANSVMTVEVGDSKQSSFYPQLKLMVWDNEANLSVRFSSDIKDATYEKDINDKITWVGKDNVKVRMYEKPDPNFANTDGFEFEFELPSKPATNVFEMTIQKKELRFQYQSALTQEDIDRGIVRPENVIGSYAVYHSTKKDNEYKTGKAFHIYRPEAIDAKGNKTWCDLNISTDTDILSITIPQKFLDNAAYPVIVDPTFGRTTAGASTAIAASTEAYACKFTANATANIDKLVAYTKKSGSGTSPSMKCVMWGGGTVPVAVLTNGVTPAVSITSETAAWIDFTYSSKPAVTNTTVYRLGGIGNADWPAIVWYYDGDYALDDNMSYATPGVWENTYGDPANFDLSIYASYSDTPAATPRFLERAILRGVGRGILKGI